MENFAEISVMEQNLYYNPWEMNILFCDIVNYIFHCVYLLYKAIKSTVCVVCTVKWQKYFITWCLFCTNFNRGLGRYTKISVPRSPTYRGSTEVQ